MTIWITLLVLQLLGPKDSQFPRIGIIDFYGMHSISESQVRQALQIKEGDSLPDSPKEAEGRLERLPGVVQARLHAVCCDGGKLILYVGIKEKASPSLQFRSSPRGTVRLPDDILLAGEAFEKALKEATEKGDTGEDQSRGYSLAHNIALNAIQSRFITLAANNFSHLRKVLRNSADAHHRALAAQVLAYAENRQVVATDLIYALRDSSEEVRNNSMRALWVMANSPERHLRIPAQPFIRLLDSIEWTDRNKASLVLLDLTRSRDPVILSNLRRQSLPSLLEMARWKSAGHRQAAFLLLARIGGLSEDEIQKAWQSGDLETVTRAAMKRASAN